MQVDANLAANGGGTDIAMSDLSDPSTSTSAAALSLPASASAATPPPPPAALAAAAAQASSAASVASSPPPPPPAPHELARQFDLRRPIRTLLPASHQVTIPVRLLNAELTCIICLGIIRSATAVADCLHRFCAQCINQSLRHHKKQCPQCRVACPSHRNLRKDDMFDHIIGSIYPDLEKAEYDREKAAEALIDSAGLSKFAESAVKGAQKQAADAKQRLAETRRLQEEAKVEEKARRLREENSVYLRLQPLPSSTFDVSLGKTSVRTRKHISVDLLRLWIENKLKEMWREAHKADTLATGHSTSDTTAVPPSAPRVRVSIWCRWSEMSDVSRQLWNKAREQPPPPPPPPVTVTPSTATNDADSNSLIIRLPKHPPTTPTATCSYNGDNNTAVPSTTQPASSAAPAARNATTDSRMHVDDASSTTTSRKRKRAASHAIDDVAGFVSHTLIRSEYCQLGNRTPLRTLPSAVLDDSRVMGGRSGGGSGMRRITLLYQADEVDADGQITKKLAVAQPQQANGGTAPHPATAPSTAPVANQTEPSNNGPPSPTSQLTPLRPAAILGGEFDSATAAFDSAFILPSPLSETASPLALPELTTA